ncbi:hypothetical protein SDC9_153901 [bioreactor metagenome]|uniref:Uncharacterized protein n=1 Tax=bioreactor metagenome TaxID=1076179 RepID=A0A645EX67_9ZZZZ
MARIASLEGRSWLVLKTLTPRSLGQGTGLGMTDHTGTSFAVIARSGLGDDRGASPLGDGFLVFFESGGVHERFLTVHQSSSPCMGWSWKQLLQGYYQV